MTLHKTWRHALVASIREVLKLTDPCCDSVWDHGVTHHDGHYWPHLPNHWELDPPLAAATPPGPNANILHLGGWAAPSLFHWIPASSQTWSKSKKLPKLPLWEQCWSCNFRYCAKSFTPPPTIIKTSCCCSLGCKSWVFNVSLMFLLSINDAKLNHFNNQCCRDLSLATKQHTTSGYPTEQTI